MSGKSGDGRLGNIDLMGFRIALVDSPNLSLATQAGAVSTLQKCLDFNLHYCGTWTLTHSPNRIDGPKSIGVPGPTQMDFCEEGSSHSAGLVFHIDIVWKFYH